MSQRSAFRLSCQRSGLVSQEQLDRALQLLRRPPNGPQLSDAQVTDELLAAKLIEQGVLTSYQAKQLRDGRTKLRLGPYLITDFLGQGGMGQVFKAVHGVMGRQCAVKVLPFNKSTPEAIESFRREIRMQAQLDHPNLVRAYDAGQDGNVHYLVTEFVEGTDLRKLVRAQGLLTMQQAARVIRQAALGLDYAHQRGLIHRDVKPGNILVTTEGDAKVSDLGLAGFMNEGKDDPRAGKIVGTADYLSPEQIKNPSEITPASDVYSLGCTLYYAVTAKVPFPGGSVREKARRHLEETPWHPKRFNPEISEEFVEIIADMMEKDPESRIKTAADVAARLEPWASVASLIPSQKMTSSPWTPAPVPTGLQEENLAETAVGFVLDDEPESRSQESQAGTSQISQGSVPPGWAALQATDSLATTDTRGPRPHRRVVPPPLVGAAKRNNKTDARGKVFLALMIAVPIALVAGIVMGFLLASMFGPIPGF